MELFGHERAWFSIVFTDLMLQIYDKFHRKLFWNRTRLTPEVFTRCYTAVHENGEPSGQIWSFIDGTIKAICRPGKTTAPQRMFYSGFKKKNMAYTVVTPAGLTMSIAGPWEGSKND
ncbi:hypothetical protein FN846DRAFT_779693 [Sphaerosporella brunnea]|uniref:DDE Tnp4 domain-containing protein n=1 Tax=Sphaerosporella brunnea TaxID=1250544 RepID=A0A5J5EUD1_9PEZI|nr:hypothetical protein FN846DRAFT_779693 [Sphaerosporella brunnea]